MAPGGESWMSFVARASASLVDLEQDNPGELAEFVATTA